MPTTPQEEAGPPAPVEIDQPPVAPEAHGERASEAAAEALWSLQAAVVGVHRAGS